MKCEMANRTVFDKTNDLEKRKGSMKYKSVRIDPE